MDNLETQGRQRRRLYIVLGASFIWAALLCVWFFVGVRVPKISNALLSHPWAIMAFVLGVSGLFWILFWRHTRGSERFRKLALLKLCSDALLIALFAGLFLWNWPSIALILIGFGLVLSYAARFTRAAVTLTARSGAERH